MKSSFGKLYQSLPDTPGVYLMRDAKGALLYVGKAANLRRRVSSYFLRPHDARIQALVSKIAKIDHEKTDTAIEALILEAKLIKKYEPPYNIREKDDKSFLYVVITKEKCPRVLLVRGKDLSPKPDTLNPKKVYGPFTSTSNLREALKIIRRIFPYNTHEISTRNPIPHTRSGRPCFDYEIGLCPGFCGGKGDLKEYRKSIKHVILFFEGKKERVLKALEKDMRAAARKLDYEKAEKLRRQIFALKHIRDIALISEDKVASSEPNTLHPIPLRIEGYDISNISGANAVGSMVVFEDGEPNKNEYRKFKIKTVTGPDDTGMLTEVLTRRFRNAWRHPDILLIDGGRGQVNAVKKVLKAYDLSIPIVGLAKGPERKRNDLVGLIPKGLQVDLKTLIRVRDEAHRFAVAYHKNLRGRHFFDR